LTRGCSSSPNIGSPEPTTEQTGSPHTLPPRRLPSKPIAPPRRSAAPSSRTTSPRSAAHLDLAVVKRAQEIRRSPG
jgi:hypothetical protein